MTIFNTGVNPSSIAISPNGETAYVTNSNNYGIAGNYTVTVLDLITNLPKTTIFDPSFDEPYRMAISKNGKRVYVANSASPSKVGEEGTVTIIDADTANGTVVGLITGFDGPSLR